MSSVQQPRRNLIKPVGQQHLSLQDVAGQLECFSALRGCRRRQAQQCVKCDCNAAAIHNYSFSEGRHARSVIAILPAPSNNKEGDARARMDRPFSDVMINRAAEAVDRSRAADRPASPAGSARPSIASRTGLEEGLQRGHSRNHRGLPPSQRGGESESRFQRDDPDVSELHGVSVVLELDRPVGAAFG